MLEVLAVSFLIINIQHTGIGAPLESNRTDPVESVKTTLTSPVKSNGTPQVETTITPELISNITFKTNAYLTNADGTGPFVSNVTYPVESVKTTVTSPVITNWITQVETYTTPEPELTYTFETNAPFMTKNETDYNFALATIVAVCTVIATTAAVITLYLKCRKTDEERDFDEICERIDYAYSRTSDQIRIVLIGKSGIGKSETGNSILGCKRFKSNISPVSVTQICESETRRLFGYNLQITDTPGLFDPNADISDTQNKIANFIDLTVPGPHILLFVLQTGRITQEDLESLNKFKQQFGGAVENHIVVVFTHSNVLKKEDMTEKQYIKSATTNYPMLERFKDRCVFIENDNSCSLQNQLKQLLNVVNRVISENNTRWYSNDMYEKRLSEVADEKRRKKEKNREIEQKKEKDIMNRIEAAKLEERGRIDQNIFNELEKSNQNSEELKAIIMKTENMYKEQNIQLEKQGHQVQQQHEDHNRHMGLIFSALVKNLNERTVCGIKMNNKTNNQLSNHVINLDSGKIFLDPTVDVIDKDAVCMMVAHNKTVSIYGTHGLISWNISNKDYKVAIMWSVPYFGTHSRVAVGFPILNDASTLEEMSSNDDGERYCRQEFETNETKSSVEMRYDGLKISGKIRPGNRTIVQVELTKLEEETQQ